MNLHQATAATLTARLMGDPDPRRWERADQLRAAVAHDFQEPLTPEERRPKILRVLKSGPLAANVLAEMAGLRDGDVRHDLLEMKRDGLIEKSGGRRGTGSTVRWRLAGTAEPPGADFDPRPSVEIKLEKILVLLGQRDGLSSAEVASAIGSCRSRAGDALKTGVERGLVERHGDGKVGTTPVYRLARAVV